MHIIMRTTLINVVKKKFKCDYLDDGRSYVMFIIEVKTRLVSGTETFWVRREIVLCYKSYCKVFPVELSKLYIQVRPLSPYDAMWFYDSVY